MGGPREPRLCSTLLPPLNKAQPTPAPSPRHPPPSGHTPGVSRHLSLPLLLLLLPSLALAGGGRHSPAAKASPARTPGMSCLWRAGSPAPDNPLLDPGAPWTVGQRLSDAGWRALDDHMQRHHFGLWTSDEIAALECTPGVALAVMRPFPPRVGPMGGLDDPDEAGVIQWPRRVSSDTMVLVAVGDADPSHDWVLRTTADPSPSHAPVTGALTAPSAVGATGFYRVHRLVTSPDDRGRLPPVRAERVATNPWLLETELVLSTSHAILESEPDSPATALLASGTFTVRTFDEERLTEPVVVHLSILGPGADLFALEVLPAAGEKASSVSRDVRVRDTLSFRVVAPPSAHRDSAFLDQVLPPGQVMPLEVRAEIVSFANDQGEDLDFGLSTTGFSWAPGEPVVLPPSRQVPRSVLLRTARLLVERASPR